MLVLTSKKRWNEEEQAFLALNYHSKATPSELQTGLPGRTWNAIKLQARSLGLLRPGNSAWCNTVSNLCGETPLAYYWLGYLLADGSFDARGRVRVSAALCDTEHLEEFAAFAGAKIRIEQRMGGWKPGAEFSTVSVMNKESIQAIMHKFSISTTKTYHPPCLENIEDDVLFLCLVIGIIDGDGHIRNLKDRNDCNIIVKMHSSWVPALTLICHRVARITGTHPVLPRIEKHGYAVLCWSNMIPIQHMRRLVDTQNLPVLMRKWKKVDPKIVGRREQRHLNKQAVARLIQKMSQRQIAQKLGISCAHVCQLTKEINWKGAQNEQWLPESDVQIV